MQTLFLQDIRFKQSDGSDFPEWSHPKLGEIVQTFSGGTPASTFSRYYGGKIPFIKSGEINSIKTSQHLTEEGFINSSAKIVNKGDLLYALYGATTGEVAISRIKGAINQAVLCIRTLETPKYIYYYLEFMKDRLKSKFLQGGQGNFSAEIVKEIDIRLPEKKEQELIANSLTNLDKKIDAVSQKITQLETYKLGLLQKMFI